MPHVNFLSLAKFIEKTSVAIKQINPIRYIMKYIIVNSLTKDKSRLLWVRHILCQLVKRYNRALFF